MAKFTPAVRRLLLGTAAVFVLLVALRLHGFSLPIWHELIDGSRASEILLGEARFIRADDWAAQLPIALAQTAHDPPFPVVNRDLGAGQNMLAPAIVPVAHAVTLFRPTVWGFFIGPEVGLAWMWWSQFLGLFAAWFTLLLIVTRNRVALAAAGGALVALSPFFQLYSLNAAPVATYLALCFVATVGLATASRRRALLGFGGLLGWAGGAFALTLYPPYLVALAYLYLALTAGFLIDAWPRLDLKTQLGTRVASLVLAVAIALGGVASFAFGAADVIAAMQATEYPGARFETGGDGDWVHFVSANLFGALRIDEYRPIGNICGSASFWLLAPVVAAFALWQRVAKRVRLDAMLAALFVYSATLLWYRHLGFSETLARASLFSNLLVIRTVIGIGLADLLIVLRYLALDTPAARRGEALALAALGAAGLGAGAVALHSAIPEIRWPVSAALIALNAAVMVAALQRFRPALLIGAIAVGMAVSTLWFNPLVRGGVSELARTPLAAAISAIDAREGGETVWVTYGDPRIPNLFRMLGVHALDGLHFAPDFELWRSFDPDGEKRSVYNRYAQIRFRLPDQRAGLSVTPPWTVFANYLPSAPELRDAGVTHLLVKDSERLADRRFWERFEALERVGDYRLYALPLRPRG